MDGLYSTLQAMIQAYVYLQLNSNTRLMMNCSVSADYGIWTSNASVVSETCTTRPASFPFERT